MAAVYPTSVKTYTTKQNHIDVYDADHVNDLQTEVVALQTYLGTNPHGDRGNLSDRMNALSSGSGGFYPTNADFTGASTYPGRFWYRTDLEALRSVKADGSIQTIGGSFSNLVYIFNGHGKLLQQPNMIISNNLAGTNSPSFVYLSENVTSGSWSSDLIGTSRFLKFTGINTIKFYAKLWAEPTAGTNIMSFRLKVGGLSSTCFNSSVAGSTPTWTSEGSLDVSGLTVGSAYDLDFNIRHNFGGAKQLYLGQVLCFGA